MIQNESHNVLLVCDSLGCGGAERQLTLLATHLPAPWRVTVVSLGGGLYADALREAGVELVLLPRRFRFDLIPFWSLARFVWHRRPAVVHSWGHMSCMTVDPVCRLCRIPHVAGVIRRGTVYSLRGRWPQLASLLGDFALANSRAGLEAFRVPPRRGRVLPNGMDPERLAKATIGQRPHEPFRVVMAATMDERKDFGTLIAATRRLAAEGSVSVRVAAFGAGPLLDEYRNLASDLVASGTMVFPGQVSEILDHLADAHVGVLLNPEGWGEGISNSIMEYMAAGLPVIATRAGGTPELVRDGETGFLIPPGGEDVLVSHLLRLEGDRELAAAMGRAGRARIESDFSLEAMTERACEIYQEAMSANPG